MAQAETTKDPHDELLALRDEFERSTTPLQRLMGQIRCHLGSPAAVIIAVVLVLGWMVLNVLAARRALDPAPFGYLNTFVSVSALLATIMLLAGQRREDEAARRVSRLTLHLAAESEVKIAKLIQLVEEQRRDSSVIPDRQDEEATQMASPARPREVLERLEGELSNG
jgi:uncharacterized membrane protein